MHAERTDSPPLECPRCGYPLATAITAAKVRGEAVVVCSECGLDSDVRVLETGTDCPPWHIESRARRHSVVVRYLATLLHSLRPNRYWRAVRMEAPISRRGLLASLACTAIALHLLAFLTVAPAVVIENRFRNTSSLPDLAFAAALPLCPALGSDIMRAAAQGSPDRAVDFGTVSRFVLAALHVTFERERLMILQHVPQAAGADGLYAVNPAPPPQVATDASFEVRHGVVGAQRGLLAGVFIALPGVVATALLVLIPTSLRRAKIRRAHLVRAAVHATVMFPAVFTLQAVGSFLLAAGGTLDLIPTRLAQWIAFPIAGVMIYGSPIFTFVWLRAVCRHYLRLPRAWLIALLLTIAAVLAVVIAAAGSGVE
jgi:hypothetical protein